MIGYPHRFDEVGIWAEEHEISLVEARRRFVQLTVLSAIAGNRSLQASLVFKGGNALDFVWQPNRSTLDLDFSIDHQQLAFAIEEEVIRRLFDTSLRVVSQRYAVRLAVHSVKQEPPGRDRTFATYVVRIGYALPDEPKLRARMDQGRPSSNILDVEISINEPIGASSTAALNDSASTLRVATLEDIVAEKLRALLQQPIRNRERRQDLLDIAVIARLHPELDLGQVSQFFIAKCEARSIAPHRRMFSDPEILRRASVGYIGLEATTRSVFIPVEEAWGLVMQLVAKMAIPGD